ncbi:hypothetical protein E2C01_033577 [Portunus trituberculatus]|uniref:Uncharacterized protein n=1 Tax=Portunus trituberculatus TaxID=210409 RepID=A0A5B7F0H5_PORTR|nr:hypothetical protein [Portunus trituberculatus]
MTVREARKMAILVIVYERNAFRNLKPLPMNVTSGWLVLVEQKRSLLCCSIVRILSTVMCCGRGRDAWMVVAVVSGEQLPLERWEEE